MCELFGGGRSRRRCAAGFRLALISFIAAYKAQLKRVNDVAPTQFVAGLKELLNAFEQLPEGGDEATFFRVTNSWDHAPFAYCGL